MGNKQARQEEVRRPQPEYWLHFVHRHQLSVNVMDFSFHRLLLRPLAATPAASPGWQQLEQQLSKVRGYRICVQTLEQVR